MIAHRLLFSADLWQCPHGRVSGPSGVFGPGFFIVVLFPHSRVSLRQTTRGAAYTMLSYDVDSLPGGYGVGGVDREFKRRFHNAFEEEMRSRDRQSPEAPTKNRPPRLRCTEVPGRPSSCQPIREPAFRARNLHVTFGLIFGNGLINRRIFFKYRSVAESLNPHVRPTRLDV